MKKSKIYKALQVLVLRDCDGITVSYDEKLQILRELMAQEDLAEFTEEQAEKANEAVTGG